jgi:hypothetical protein
MQQLIPTVRKAIVGVVAVGALSLGVAGLAGTAGAATPASSTPAATRLARFNCANATTVLDKIAKGEADIAAGLPKLTAAQAKAAAAGHTKVADKLQKRITRLESAGFKARLDKAASAIEAKCNVPAPGSTTSAS